MRGLLLSAKVMLQRKKQPFSPSKEIEPRRKARCEWTPAKLIVIDWARYGHLTIQTAEIEPLAGPKVGKCLKFHADNFEFKYGKRPRAIGFQPANPANLDEIKARFNAMLKNDRKKAYAERKRRKEKV